MANVRTARRPHDATDLYLAPVTLAVDARLEELAVLSPEELAAEISLTTNLDPRGSLERERAVVATATYPLDLHGWEASLSHRGIRLSHGDRSLALGLPANVRDYLNA